MVLIGIAGVSRRSLALLWPQRFAGNAGVGSGLDTGFARHAALTFVHILPGAFFLGFAPCSLRPDSARGTSSSIDAWGSCSSSAL
jgi:hypothetical protein